MTVTILSAHAMWEYTSLPAVFSFFPKSSIFSHNPVISSLCSSVVFFAAFFPSHRLLKPLLWHSSPFCCLAQVLQNHLSAAVFACKKYLNCFFFTSSKAVPIRLKNKHMKSSGFSSALSPWKESTCSVGMVSSSSQSFVSDNLMKGDLVGEAEGDSSNGVEE